MKCDANQTSESSVDVRLLENAGMTCSVMSDCDVLFRSENGGGQVLQKVRSVGGGRVEKKPGQLENQT